MDGMNADVLACKPNVLLNIYGVFAVCRPI